MARSRLRGGFATGGSWSREQTVAGNTRGGGLYSPLSQGRMKLRSYLRTQPLSSRMRSASMNSFDYAEPFQYSVPATSPLSQ